MAYSGLSIILILGLLLLSGFTISRVFQRLGIPQVVGYVILGLFLGESFLNLLSADFLEKFAPITEIALAFIGFMVGGELNRAVFQKYGKNYLLILLFEGVLAMIAVSMATWFLTHNISLALLLGALASATAPAATVNVIWEYGARGVLSSTILAIVALDDGLALLLYAFAISIASTLSGFAGHQDINVFSALVDPLLETGGAILIGVLGSLLIDTLLKVIKIPEQRIVILLGVLLSVCGLAIYFKLSLIMSSLAMGTILTNWKHDRHQNLFDLLKTFSPPIYLFFFLFAGARLNLAVLPGIGVIGVAYIGFRFAGKYIGSYLGGKVSKSPVVISKYLGLALFSQAGVAIGLSIDIYHKFKSYGPQGAELGEHVMSIIAAVTLVVELIGPYFVKLALQKAGELPENMSRRK